MAFVPERKHSFRTARDVSGIKPTEALPESTPWGGTTDCTPGVMMRQAPVTECNNWTSTALQVVKFRPRKETLPV